MLRCVRRQVLKPNAKGAGSIGELPRERFGLVWKFCRLLSRKDPDSERKERQSWENSHKQFIVQHGRKAGVMESKHEVWSQGRIGGIYRHIYCLRGKVQMTPKWIDSIVAPRQEQKPHCPSFSTPPFPSIDRA